MAAYLEDRYEFGDELDRLPLGRRFKAKDRRFGEPVAVSVLEVEGEGADATRAQFTKDADALERLRHPHVVRVRDVGRSRAGHPYMATEPSVGQSIGTRLEETPSLLITDLLRIIAGALDGLAAVHAIGTTHGDIELAHICLFQGGSPKLTGFGLNCAWDRTGLVSAQDRDARVQRSLAYMAPEQARGEAPTPQSDIFSMGVVLYDAIAGALPWPTTERDAVRETIAEGIFVPLSERRPEVTGPLVRTIERALQLNPHERFESATSMRKSLMSAMIASPEVCQLSLPIAPRGQLEASEEASQVHVRAPGPMFQLDLPDQPAKPKRSEEIDRAVDEAINDFERREREEQRPDVPAPIDPALEVADTTKHAAVESLSAAPEARELLEDETVGEGDRDSATEVLEVGELLEILPSAELATKGNTTSSSSPRPVTVPPPVPIPLLTKKAARNSNPIAPVAQSAGRNGSSSRALAVSRAPDIEFPPDVDISEDESPGADSLVPESFASSPQPALANPRPEVDLRGESTVPDLPLERRTTTWRPGKRGRTGRWLFPVLAVGGLAIGWFAWTRTQREPVRDAEVAPEQYATNEVNANDEANRDQPISTDIPGGLSQTPSSEVNQDDELEASSEEADKKTVAVTLTPLPDNAVITVDGETRRPPIEVPNDGKPHAIAVDVPGYQTWREQVSADGNLTFYLKLERITVPSTVAKPSEEPKHASRRIAAAKPARARKPRRPRKTQGPPEQPNVIRDPGF